MICWKCGYLNEDTRQFCENCGADIWHADSVPNKPPQNGIQQNENQEDINYQNTSHQHKNYQNTNHQNPNHQNTNVQTGGNRSSFVSSEPSEPEKNSMLKIAALVFVVLYLIKTIMLIPSFFSVLGGIFNGRHLFISIIVLFFSTLWMLSFVLLVGALFLLAMRRTNENGEYLYLSVVLAEALHVAVAVLRLLWNMNIILIFAIYRGSMSAKAFLSELLILLFALAVLALLFVLFSREGQKPLLGRSMDEVKQMVKDLPAVLQTEFEILSAQLSREKASREGRDKTQTFFSEGSYGGQSSFWPGLAAEGAVKTNRSLFLFIILTFLTCGIYGWYYYYSVAKDANIICAGDGEETAGLLKHILLLLVTCGIYEYIWQCQLADRLRRNASRYGVTIGENGTTVFLWMLPGSWCCGLGVFVAYHIQMKNINKLARAYNEKMFAQNRTNI